MPGGASFRPFRREVRPDSPRRHPAPRDAGAARRAWRRARQRGEAGSSFRADPPPGRTVPGWAAECTLASEQHARERCPAAIQRGGEGLEIRREGRAAVGDRVEQGTARKPCVRRGSQAVQHRRHDVDVPRSDRRREAARAPGSVGRADDQRNVQRVLVREEPVRRFPVSTECLSVVGGQNDKDRSPPPPDGLEQGLERAIDRRHLSRVRVGRVLAIEWWRRRVRRVRVVEVNPREPRASLFADPPGCCRRNRRRRPFGHRQLAGARRGVPVVVDVEAGIEAEARIQRKRADEGTRRVAPRAQAGGERRHARAQPVAGVVADPVSERIQPRENGGMRRQRDHAVRVCRVEADAVRGEPIDVRGGGGAAVHAEGVRTQRVDRDEEHIAIRARNNRGRAGGLPRKGGADENEDRGECGARTRSGLARGVAIDRKPGGWRHASSPRL